MISQNTQSKTIDTKATTLEPFFDIDSFKNFEEKLNKSSSYEDQLVEKFSLICGRDDKRNEIDICYRLVDYFLERNFINEFSWTGNKREDREGGPSKTKHAMKFFTNFRRYILKIVRKGHKDFSKTECDRFFKTIMKNSLQRKNMAKIDSKHKNRPKNLKYKKKNLSNEIQ